MDNIIGNRIKEKRISIGKTQEELGQLVHVKKQTISKWENGINVPDADTLKILSDILDCTVDYLVGKTDNSNSKVYSQADVKIELSKSYPYDLSPEQVSLLIELLKNYRFDIDSLIKDIKEGKVSREL